MHEALVNESQFRAGQNGKSGALRLLLRIEAAPEQSGRREAAA
jgi:hypothetical protein